MNEQIFSVSQLNNNARQLLEQHLGSIWLTGEISNFTQPVSGHWYLTLKDENAQVRCAMFRMKNLRVTFRPANGMQVLVRATVSLYEPRGDYQLIIDAMHLAGEGLLQKQFDALKMKLAAEGLFATHLKKALPDFAKSVGIVTSATGAALQDILQILQRRDPSLKIVIYPTAVQGKDAGAEIVQMIELANARQEVDVLIVGRGGGSLEDLWCFNEENVARAIFDSQLPIISAVGHETDVTITDFVADIRAPTPSAAAELVSRNQQDLMQHILYQRQRLDMALDRALQQKQRDLTHLIQRLQSQHPQAQLNAQYQQMQQLQQRLQSAMQWRMNKTQLNFSAVFERLQTNPLPYVVQQRMQQCQQLQTRLQFALQRELKQREQQFAMYCGKLDSLSPLKVLSRGYSIAQNQQGVAITTLEQVGIGEKLRTTLLDGVVISQVVALENPQSQHKGK